MGVPACGQAGVEVVQCMTLAQPKRWPVEDLAHTGLLATARPHTIAKCVP